MREQRGWIVAGVLMLLGVAAGAGAVWRHWLVCTGPQTMTGTSGTEVGTEFGAACLQAMDDGFLFLYPDGKDPWRSEAVFGLLFALLLAAAWAVVLATSRWSRTTRWVAVLPVVLALVLVVLDLQPRSDALDSTFARVSLALSASVLLALVVVVRRDTADVREAAKVALVLCAPAAVGTLASIADYSVMVTLSQANWDTPPWTGTPTLVATAFAGVALIVVSVRGAASRPESPPRSGGQAASSSASAAVSALP